MNESEESRPQVLGIALVVEELGKGSRLIFRYPAASSSSNIFFTLPPRVFAKLFHTKQSLCGQPVTLLIDGTMICCRSVMLQNTSIAAASTSSIPSSTSAAPSEDMSAVPIQLQYSDGLVMFSLVVALLPVQRQTRRPTNTTTYTSISNHNTQDPSDKVSVAYPIIRRIHLSLARLSSVLEREERRCLYVSRQVAMLIHVANSLDVEKETEQRLLLHKGISLSTLKDPVEGSPKPNPNTSVISTENHHHHRVREHMDGDDEYERTERMLSAKPPSTLEYEMLESLYNMTSSNAANLDQQVLGKLMIPLYGNLASELAQVYYSLARDDSVFRNPAYLLSNREGIVYVNNHIAVTIEAAVVSDDSKLQDDFRDNMPLLRPYHTILFPRVSARELLINIHTSFPSSRTSSPNNDGSNSIMQGGDLSQRRLEKLLSVCDPTKSLNDMSMETALPLSVITDIALRLVESGVCIAVPQLQSSVKFACQHDAVQKMTSLRMTFAQEFSQIPIFVVTSALTVKPNYNKTFGEIVRYCKDMARIEDAKEQCMNESLVQGESIDAIPLECQVLTRYILNSVKSASSADEENNLIYVQQVEFILRKMTSWLRSHSVIVELKDYLVSIHDENTADSAPTIVAEDGKETEKEPIITLKKSNSAGDMIHQWSDSDGKSLYDICMKNKYFSGKVSTSALAWRIGKKQMEIVREYGIRENLLKVTTRIPCIGEDDWGAP